MLNLTLAITPDLDWALLRAFVAAGDGLPGGERILVERDPASGIVTLVTFVQPDGY